METNVNYTIVGAFVITLLSATILAIIWLSSGFSFVQYRTYMIYSQESVNGLSIDAPVEYNGVNVGSVKSIDIDKTNPHLVIVLLNISVGTPITRGTYATLTTRGITGITYIALKDTSTDLRPLIAERGQRYPVIKTSPSLFTRLDTTLRELSMNFRKISEAMQTLLNKENQESIRMTLHNLQEVTGTLAANSQKLNTILENTSRASRQFGPLLQSGIGTMHVLETQTLPAAYRMLNNLDETTRTLAQVAAELKQNPSILIRGTAPAPLGPGEPK